MSFFYNLNKTLDAIREKPELTHGQLNERDMSRAAKGYEKYGKEGMEALAKAGREGKALDPVRAKYDKYDDKPVDEGMGDMARKVGGMVKKAGGKVLDKLGHGDDAEMMRDLQRKMGMPQTGMKPGNEPNPKQVKEKMNPAKAKSFAALAEPKDKITFADKIAGAKKEVDEMLGDVAAEAMKSALSGGQKKLDKNNNGRLDANDFAMLRKGGKKEVADEGFPTVASARADMHKRKVGDVTHGAKHDVEEIPGGRRVTRRTDAQGYSVGSETDDEGNKNSGEKRGRGRPKSTPKGPERVTANATKHKGGRKTNEGDHDSDEIKQAMAMLKKAGYKITKSDTEELDEKAVSKKQQKFMGMVHATQKGEKAPSKAVAKVASTMKKGDAEDFASTKHKGLPEKKKPEVKKEKTEETADSTPSKGGMKFGGGIYDSMNRDLENMIAESMSQLSESMSINMSDSTEGGKSLTITASEEDAVKLAMLLKSAGLGGSEGYGGAGYKSACGCGTPDCSCGDQQMDEVSMNQPDYPTNTETSDDALQYSGGLNKPKSTGQTTVPVIASQQDRQESYAAEEEDAIKRMMEMAGIKEGKKPDFLDVDKDGDKAEPFKKAVDDKKEKKVDEGILASTANLWSQYKG